MKRSFGRNWKRAGWACVWLLLGGWCMAQTPDQHWQATPNYPSNYPPNYQPSTAAGTPTAGPPSAGQYQTQPQPDQPVGPPQYPTIERRQPAPAGQPGYGSPPPDNRAVYPQDPQAQGAAGQRPPIQGPPERNAPPRAPFELTPEQTAKLENLLTDWERRNKQIQVLESKFYRWKYDNAFGSTDKPPAPEEGVLKFSAPDKGMMKVEAKDPAQSEQWLCDGKSIFQFNYKDRLVTEYVMPPELQGKGIGDGPLPFVFGVEAQKLKQRYFMRIITPPNVQNNAVWLEAYPRYQQQAAEFSKVEVILKISDSTKELLPFAIQMYSPNGKDRTVYQLENPSINPHVFIKEIFNDWRKVSIPFGWKKKTELPPPPVQAGLSPSMTSRR